MGSPVEWRCNPGVRIENTRIHRIPDADVAGEEPFAARIDDLAALLTAAPSERIVLVAHNASFDVGVLHLEHQRAGRTLPDVEVLDTLALADATDTAAALTRLLHAAARQDHTDLAALLAAAQPDRPRQLAAGPRRRADERAAQPQPETARPWLGPSGRLVEHAKVRPAVAAHAAWLVVNNLNENRPDDANDLAALADQLGLVEPRLVHRSPLGAPPPSENAPHGPIDAGTPHPSAVPSAAGSRPHRCADPPAVNRTASPAPPAGAEART